MTTTLRKLSYFLSLLAVVAIIGCGKKEKDQYADDETDGGGEKTESTAMATVDMANGATINGKVILDGGTPMPVPTAIKMDADPVCKAAHSAAQMDNFWMVDAGGGVQYAFVYIKDGLGGKQYAPSSDASLEQKGCMYSPRVQGVVVGTKVKITNDDKTLHNVHAFGEKNEQFNEGQPAGSPAKEKVLDKAEVMIPFKCDVHGWMKSYVGVLTHPFFAVTGADGSYSIKGVPAGSYTVTCWHESSKGTAAGVTADQQVTLAAKETKAVDFKVKAE